MISAASLLSILSTHVRASAPLCGWDISSLRVHPSFGTPASLPYSGSLVLFLLIRPPLVRATREDR